MKAVVITRFGGPEVLEIQDVPAPQPGPEEVLVRVHGTALNRADLLQRSGRYAAPPGVPENISGLEFAGEVTELGINVRRWSKGDRVMGIIGGGAHAEFVTAHQDAIAAVPANLDLSDAGAIPEVFITAHDALQQAEFKAGENVLIHAVGSGVGLAATQLVRALGGRAFGTSRTPDKIERAKAFGLELGYVVPEPGALSELSAFGKNATAGRGFDVVLDLNGGPYFEASLEAMALKGRIILIGGVAGGKTNVDLSDPGQTSSYNRYGAARSITAREDRNHRRICTRSYAAAGEGKCSTSDRFRLLTRADPGCSSTPGIQ